MQKEQWDRWLVEADSEQELAPEDYDYAAAKMSIRALQRKYRESLPSYSFRFSSGEVYQDGTALTDGRVCAVGNEETLAWVLVSNFGALATISECADAELLNELRKVLVSAGYKYIDYDYLSEKIYNGLCKRLVGLNCVNRFFSIVPEFNDHGRQGDDR